jgi:ABC-2 type transporter
MAALIWLAFLHFPGDARELESFNRSLYYFSRSKEPYLQSSGSGQQRTQGRPLPAEELLGKAQEQARTEQWMISPQMAQRRGAVYFVLVAAAVWLGVVAGCREIVIEKHVLRREARTCIRLGPYLAAKLAGQMALAAVQCALLTLLVAPGLLGVSPLKLVGVWLALWVTAGAACSLGLAISAAAPSYRAALTAVPLVLIPQLLFGGLLRPNSAMAPGSGLSRVAGWLTFQRWGFESALAMDQYAANGVMLQEFPPKVADGTDAFQFIQSLEFKDVSLASVFFGGSAAGLGFGWPLLVLGAEAALFLGLSHRFLTRSLGLRPPDPVESR